MSEAMDDLFRRLTSEVAGELAGEIRTVLREVLVEQSVSAAVGDAEFDLWRLYTAREAADILGLDRSTIYDIPEHDLPRCRVGPSRGSTRFMGADLLAYMKGLEPVDYEQMIRELRKQLRKPSNVRRLDRSAEDSEVSEDGTSTGGKTRVL